MRADVVAVDVVSSPPMMTERRRKNRAPRRGENGIEGRKDKCPSCEKFGIIPFCISGDDSSCEDQIGLDRREESGVEKRSKVLLYVPEVRKDEPQL